MYKSIIVRNKDIFVEMFFVVVTKSVMKHHGARVAIMNVVVLVVVWAFVVISDANEDRNVGVMSKVIATCSSNIHSVLKGYNEFSKK